MKIEDEVLEKEDHQEVKLKEALGHYLIKKFLENQILPLLRILLPPLTNQQDHL